MLTALISTLPENVPICPNCHGVCGRVDLGKVANLSQGSPCAIQFKKWGKSWSLEENQNKDRAFNAL